MRDFSLLIGRQQQHQDSNGHDVFHLQRVVKMALWINEVEQEDSDLVMLLAWLHDEFDEKFYHGEIESDLMTLLREVNITLNQSELKQLICDLKNFGYKGGFVNQELSRIGQIVSDADRLDALGAIGIARMIQYGSSRQAKLYDLNMKYVPPQSQAEYRDVNRPMVFHFKDKLFKLKDLMFTQRGREEALRRHQFMEQFVSQLEGEIHGSLF